VENRAVYEILWTDTVEPGSPGMIIWRMRIASWLTNATNTRAQVVYYSLVFHCNNGCTNAPQYYIIRTGGVLQVAPSLRNSNLQLRFACSNEFLVLYCTIFLY